MLGTLLTQKAQETPEKPALIAGSRRLSYSEFAPCTADPGTTPRLTDYNLRGRRDRKPTEPLGFTTAADTRLLQLGVRFNL